jgi:prophage regulatory protein
MTEHFSASISASAVTSAARILRLPDVMSRVGLRRASIYLHMTKGSFPKPITLGARAVGWLESDIDGWIAARIEVTRRAEK